MKRLIIDNRQVVSDTDVSITRDPAPPYAIKLNMTSTYYFNSTIECVNDLTLCSPTHQYTFDFRNLPINNDQSLALNMGGFKLPLEGVIPHKR